MKSKILILSLILCLTVAIGAVLNIKVTTKQGVNYHVSTIELPLYLKVLNFYDRHFNYKWLVKRITGNLETKEDKIFLLFQWTHNTILPQPKSLPIMDDHVWNVYVRGYGASDNFHDLFTTLCSYVGVEAVFHRLKIKDPDKLIGLSFVKLEKGWVVFDPFKGGYFLNKMGGWATIEEIKTKNWRMEKIGSAEIADSFYKPFLEVLPDVESIDLRRANIQSPINRLKWQIGKWFVGMRSSVE